MPLAIAPAAVGVVGVAVIALLTQFDGTVAAAFDAAVPRATVVVGVVTVVALFPSVLEAIPAGALPSSIAAGGEDQSGSHKS